MATKPQSIDHEIAHFDNFKEHIPGFEEMDTKTLDMLLALGGLQVSTLFEHALANMNGSEVVNEDCCDLSDGSDAKLTTTQIHRLHRPACDAQVSNIAGKTGTLRVQVFEQYTGKLYFFAIPYRAYCHLRHSVEIHFHLNGAPNRNTKWWDYEVRSFEALANTH